MMTLYKKEGANPLSGCLPILIQIPVFFALYKVMFVTIEMRHAPFYGWIHDLSAPDPTTLLNGFGLFPWMRRHWATSMSPQNSEQPTSELQSQMRMSYALLRFK